MGQARPGGEGEGLGFAFARYKNTAAYCAVIVALTVEEEVTLNGIWTVSDAGLVINPSGARNQLRGRVCPGCQLGAEGAGQIRRRRHNHIGLG